MHTSNYISCKITVQYTKYGGYLAGRVSMPGEQKRHPRVHPRLRNNQKCHGVPPTMANTVRQLFGQILLGS